LNIEKNISEQINRQGWIKLYRQLTNKAIWKCSTPEQKVVLITLLLMADHTGNEWEWQGKKHITKPGQFITSLKSIAEKAGQGISIQNVRSSLKKFEKYEFLTNKSTKTGRLITIVNWELYQAKPEESTDKPTNDQQRGNKEVTTNKNDKECKEDIYGDFFEQLWKLYPNKRGKQDVKESHKKELYKVGFEKMKQAIDNYNVYIEKNKSWYKAMYGGRFFKSAYKDYLEAEQREEPEIISMYPDI
jgi:hypothetical protein